MGGTLQWPGDLHIHSDDHSDWKVTSGGPLPEEIGDLLVGRGVKLQTLMAGTELSLLSHFDRQKKTTSDWAWFELSDRVGIKWVDQSDGSGVHELWIVVRIPEIFVSCTICLMCCNLQDTPTFRPAMHNRETPEGPAYATSDLFIQHPTKKGLWRM